MIWLVSILACLLFGFGMAIHDYGGVTAKSIGAGAFISSLPLFVICLVALFWAVPST